ncbi:complement decay-accelerating factor isoform X2 [Mastacembelus armatus]|uniref:complement decay-accelerating factor isoform X2 n=1 Tax=Mastacembelus armatus TaxID=205130 RepID=UPI000E465215|nr:complement decay-accelerating factor-like isoform X2 [Mastacembelus armatus]
MWSLFLQRSMEAEVDMRGRPTVLYLLLMCLVIWKAAADCPKPQGKDHILLTDAALVMHNFPEGSVVTFKCTNGYERESGSDAITCINNNWTELQLICKKMDCGFPAPQPNMSFNISGGTLFGDIIKVICDKGYQISGPTYRQCYPKGWSGKPRCEVITCQSPPQVTNGRSSWDSQDFPKYGEIIHYSCNKGYTLIGKDTIVCSETGEYDSPLPECNDLKVTTEISRITPTPPKQEVSSSRESSVTPTAHREKTFSTPTVSPSEQGEIDKTLYHNKGTGYIPIIVSVVVVLLAVCIVVVFLHKFLLKRKGSSNGTVPI